MILVSRKKTDNARFCDICKLHNIKLIETLELTPTPKKQLKEFFSK